MKKTLLLFCFILTSLLVFGQNDIPYLNNATYTFSEAILKYKNIAEEYPTICKYQEIGTSDYGIAMPLFIINAGGVFTKEEYQSKNVILINNAIHPGEPCGVDASLKLVEELIGNKNALPKNIIIAIIPIYNIGGAHNRDCCSRANQNGPKEYGFRGNAKNLDLNRDFIKADSKNTAAFYRIFHLLKPAIFVDTHTSNGADYQHTLTLITSQINKMNPVLATYTKTKLNPFLFQKMEQENYPLSPYVNTINTIPDNGIKDYLESPRYSTGYTNLFNCISYVTEAHMLKPYKDRVNSTYLFLKHLIAFMEENNTELAALRLKSNTALIAQEKLALNWKIDTSKFDTIPFLGYQAKYKISKVTGQEQLFYDQNSPFKKIIHYYNTYTAYDYVKTPEYYIIPQAWDIIIEKLRLNDITVYQLTENTNIEVEIYDIIDYKTSKSPYEGHYLHNSTKIEAYTKTISYRKGDYIVPVKNENIRFIIETLEPQAADSYFNWNYFDAILQQKEWFSAYVFDEEAETILNNNPELKQEFENKKQMDSTFANSGYSQLYFIYKHSPHYEKSKNTYPITRCMTRLKGGLLK